MEDTERIEIRAEPLADEQARLTVTGPTEIIAALLLLVTATLDVEGDGEDCGDPDCPVHGDGASDDTVDFEAA